MILAFAKILNLERIYPEHQPRYDFGCYASARHVAWQVGRVDWQGGLGGDDQLKLLDGKYLAQVLVG